MKLPNLKRHSTQSNIFLLVIFTLLLTGCGGGSGGGGGSNVNSTPSISNLSFSPNAAYVNTGAISVNGSYTVDDLGSDITKSIIVILDSQGTTVSTTPVVIQNAQGVTHGVVSFAGSIDSSSYPAGNYTIQIQVADTGGRNSNVLTVGFKISTFPWVARTAMPTTRSGFAVANLNGLIYVCGGMLANTGTTPGPETAVVEIFDSVSKTWSTAPSMPTARIGSSASVLGGKLYVIGGYNSANPAGSTTVEQFDPVSQTWTQMAPMLTGRSFASAVSIGTKIFVVGGNYAGSDLATAEAYDVSNTWLTLPQMITPRSRLASDVINGVLYATGGYYTLSKLSAYQSVVEVFDPVSLKWTSTTSLLTRRANHAVVAVNGLLYKMGGYNEVDFDNAVEMFNPTTKTWSGKTPFPTTPVLNGAGEDATEVNGIIYLLGASALFEYSPTNDIL